MMGSGNLEAKQTVFVAGGSGGLGKAVAKLVASRGSHMAIFGRRIDVLEGARNEIQQLARSSSQEINAVAVNELFKAQARIPDALYCAGGGNHAQNGFLVDITANQLEACMKNNYYGTLYPIKSLVDIWIEDDRKNAQQESSLPKLRQVVIISSAAAFVALPGSIAYTPDKVAARALADTLRLEFLRYSCPSSTYSVHCAFPGDFISPGFYLEQHTKTPLTKRMQGTNSYPSSDKFALLIIGAVDDGKFIICKDSISASLLFTSMTGPSPKRGLGIMDSLVGLLVNWFVWSALRLRWEALCKKDGEEWRQKRVC
ncbi:uncharacterized protein BCR38DRAFT_491715 [Pseudomassariella vexata]|uniref:Uncharacterized protein n=1 Tax=Pseudomassariella vexata TaxID=1141098 RepID=A0A1Y2EHA6_9PEZI|nr:uncharacterized protein BCR38DRAFT_491715 [Pseudomassariella vexata]ORY70952.1 hypothetical protein BCR38DRAFT_491715 [Pseudomassariella vexata]